MSVHAVAAEPGSFFDGHPFALAAFRTVRSQLEEIGVVDIRVTKSQVALRHGRGFAFLWMPSRGVPDAADAVVLSIALDRCVDSPRFKEVVHPTDRLWMHHLEVRELTDLDDEVTGWLAEAWAGVGRRSMGAA